MPSLERIDPVMREMLSSNVLVGPALSSVGVGGLNNRQYELIRENARALYFEYCREPLRVPDADTPLTKKLAVNLLSEALTSTSAYLSHVKVGYLEIDEGMIQVAMRIIEQFMQHHSAQDTLAIAFMMHAHDDLQVLQHYGEVEVERFLSGELHRPWIHYSLADELEYLINYGSIHRKLNEEGRSFISLTKVGATQYQWMERALEDSGMLQRRLTLMRWTQFSEMEDYDRITNDLSNIQEFRNTILSESGIEPGMKVLELGCGTGAVTVDSGLYRLVGPSGKVVATDPSLGMLARAKSKAERLGVSNIEFRQARAEEIPYGDNTFDAVVGCFFLHFTHLPTLFREVHRVAKQGASFTTIYPLHFPQTNSFFTEWFAPLLARIRQGGKHADILPSEETVQNAIPTAQYADIDIHSLTGYGYYRQPESIVKFIVQAGNFFESATSNLPWRAQQDLLELLIERGRDIVRTYPSEALVEAHPAQFLRATIVK